MDATEALSRLFNACDPSRAATEQQYVDCASARGGTSLTGQLIKNLNLAERPVSYIFSGHVGCGKSSELAQLARTLMHPAPRPGKKRFFPIVVDMHDYLDDFDVELTDILLAVVSEVAHALREAGIELQPTLLSRRLAEMREYLFSDVEINEGEFSLGMVKAKVQRLKKDDQARKKVRDALAPRFSSLLDEINYMLADASSKVRSRIVPGEAPYTSIVLILDGLDVIRRFAGQEKALESAKELFLERYPVLTGFHVHIIYTAPLRLVNSEAGQQLRQRYEAAPFVLPMVKVAQRDGLPYLKGREFLVELIEKRLDGITITEVFTPEALNFLLDYSGGHVRSLMSYVRQACTENFDATPPLPIGLDAMRRAVASNVRTLSTSIPDHHWEKLARLDLSPTHDITNNDSDFLAMLENLTILEYSNGDLDADPFSDEEPWYAVNPIVRELKPFKAARARLLLNGTSSSTP